MPKRRTTPPTRHVAKLLPNEFDGTPLEGQWPDCSYEEGEHVCWTPATYRVKDGAAVYYSCKEHVDAG